MKARIIINADDFGLSSAVNEAVLDASRNGILSSATIMANMPFFEEAVQGARSVSTLGIGVHLNILRGAPIVTASDVSSLIGSDGRFLNSVPKLWSRFARGIVKRSHLERELEAQLARVVDSGIVPTHVDSEKHLHIFFPQMWETICNAARRFGIRRIRIVREKPRYFGLPKRPAPIQFIKTLLLNGRGKGLAKTASQHGLVGTDHFFGVALTGKMTSEVYEWIFNNMTSGTTEIMCHPAKMEPAFGQAGQQRRQGECEGSDRRSWLDLGRQAEYQALLDPRVKDSLDKSGARLINYGDI